MKDFFGECTTLYTTQTLFVKNYKKYHLGAFNEDFIKQRHEEVFPKVRNEAYELGMELVK